MQYANAPDQPKTDVIELLQRSNNIDLSPITSMSSSFSSISTSFTSVSNSITTVSSSENAVAKNGRAETRQKRTRMATYEFLFLEFKLLMDYVYGNVIHSWCTFR